MRQSVKYVGLDVHKDTIAVAVAENDRRSEVREHGEIENTPAALTKLLGKLGGPGVELHTTSDARAMAEQTISKQGKEIANLTRFLSKSPANPASLEPYRRAGMAMHQAMMSAMGANVSEIYLRKMLEHHRGAVALSDVVIAKGTDSPVRAVAKKTRADQTREATMIEAMLAGQPMGNTKTR